MVLMQSMPNMMRQQQIDQLVQAHRQQQHHLEVYFSLLIHFLSFCNYYCIKGISVVFIFRIDNFQLFESKLNLSEMDQAYQDFCGIISSAAKRSILHGRQNNHVLLGCRV